MKTLFVMMALILYGTSCSCSEETKENKIIGDVFTEAAINKSRARTGKQVELKSNKNKYTFKDGEEKLVLLKIKSKMGFPYNIDNLDYVFSEGVFNGIFVEIIDETAKHVLFTKKKMFDKFAFNPKEEKTLAMDLDYFAPNLERGRYQVKFSIINCSVVETEDGSEQKLDLLITSNEVTVNIE